MIDDGLEDAEAAPAELTRPVNAGPTRRRELAIPAELALPVVFVLLESAGQRRHRLARGVGLKPGPKLAAKGFVLCAVIKIHRCDHLLPVANPIPARRA